MYVVVLVLGILAIALGAVSTGYGVTIKEFSFGNSLLMIGAISIVGGLVLIGIAGAIRELHRIVDALTGRLAPRHLRAGEPNELPVRLEIQDRVDQAVAAALGNRKAVAESFGVPSTKKTPDWRVAG